MYGVPAWRQAEIDAAAAQRNAGIPHMSPWGTEVVGQPRPGSGIFPGFRGEAGAYGNVPGNQASLPWDHPNAPWRSEGQNDRFGSDFLDIGGGRLYWARL